jgi:hypothetical protein
VQGVHRLLESLEVLPKEKIEGSLLQRVHRVENSNNWNLFESLPQGVREGNPFGSLELEVKAQEG